MQESSHQSTERVKEEIRDHSIVSNHRKHIISSGSNGVEVALKNESGPYSMLVRSDQSNENNMAKKDSNDSNKNDTPPRESTGEKGKKVTVITPQEGQNHGHTRSPSYNTVDFHNELPSGECQLSVSNMHIFILLFVPAGSLVILHTFFLCYCII